MVAAVTLTWWFIDAVDRDALLAWLIAAAFVVVSAVYGSLIGGLVAAYMFLAHYDGTRTESSS